jgi:O-succinylhomoserine sulfhydrylase
MDGQGRVLGVTVGEPELIKKYIYFPTYRILITFNAWVLSKFRDFAIRLDRHCENALKVAEF